MTTAVDVVDTTPLIILSNRKGEYLPQAVLSLDQHTPDSWAPDVHIVDDSGDPAWRALLLATFGDTVAIHAVDDHPAGYSKAMQKVWQVARELDSRVFLLEEDFVFVEDFDITWLHEILDANKRLAQVALLRQPWYPNELARGVMDAQQQRVDAERGIIRRSPTAWVWHDYPHTFRSHDAGFTCNPSLLNKAVFDIDWPDGKWTETAMGNTLIARDFRFAWMPVPGGRHGAFTKHVGATRGTHSKGY